MKYHHLIGTGSLSRQGRVIIFSFLIAANSFAMPWDYGNQGYNWDRHENWVEQSAANVNTINGNPSPDAAGNPVWGFWYVSNPSNLSATSAWWLTAEQKLKWDNSWDGAPGGAWDVQPDPNSSGNDQGPNIRQMFSEVNATSDHKFTVVSWRNPLSKSIFLDVFGVIQAYWWAGATGSAEIAIAKKGDSATLLTAVACNAPADHSTVDLPVQIFGIPVAPGESIHIALRASPQTGWVSFTDRLSFRQSPDVSPTTRVITRTSLNDSLVIAWPTGVAGTNLQQLLKPWRGLIDNVDSISRTLTYVPDFNWHGSDSFSYKLGSTVVQFAINTTQPAYGQPSYFWNPQSEWGPGPVTGATNGNPAVDAGLNPAWAYAWITNTGGLSAANPWWQQPRKPMIWDGDAWRSAQGQRPAIQQWSLETDAGGTRCPVASWANPLGRPLKIDIYGNLQSLFKNSVMHFTLTLTCTLYSNLIQAVDAIRIRFD